MNLEKLNEIFNKANEKNATDIHICANAPILYRIGNDLIQFNDKELTPNESKVLSYDLMDENKIKLFEENLDIDFMLKHKEARYRVNISKNDENIGSVIRVLNESPQTFEALDLPVVLKDFINISKGLILITGSTSQGKTTTLSAMIHEINLKFKKHVITIEDPIEYVHKNINCVIRQREVGRDTKSFASGLRAALRQNPDVIAIGEMRDFETFKIALLAASTGVLVLSTLHTISIDKVIERLVSYGSADYEMHTRYLLADSLQAIIHQELMPTISGEKRIACEILVATNAVRHIFRKSGSYLLRSVMATGAEYGMITMRQSINKLLEENIISEDQASRVLLNYP
jgi:twitching motility protein PilT